jgi:hypothetical protein
MKLYKNDFYTMITVDGKLEKGIRKLTSKSKNNDLIIFAFDTEKERNNFIEYLKTDFVRFCLSFYKINGNLHRGELAIIPWLDFTEKWDDAKLYKKFNVSKELQAYITSFLPDYHKIRG